MTDMSVDVTVKLDGLGGLTLDEQEVMRKLVTAWSIFQSLPRMHPDHLDDFRRALHEQQRILATRAIARVYPDYWRTGMELSK